jgi:DNA-binding transcriptional LysR family regulator
MLYVCRNIFGAGGGSFLWTCFAEQTRRVALPSPPPGRDTWLGYHRDMRRLPRLRALIDHLIAAG